MQLKALDRLRAGLCEIAGSARSARPLGFVVLELELPFKVIESAVRELIVRLGRDNVGF